jgi:polysaccharide export outer membrane protein
MMSWANHVFRACLLIAFALSATLSGQTATTNQAVGESSNAAPKSPPAQSEAPPKTARPDDSFIIGDGDVLAINVWKEPDLTRSVPVRSDGKISLPLVGELQATGRTPLQLEQDITAKLQSYITAPQVTVIVQQINSLKFNILGEVMKPGSYPLTAGTTIVDAIAIAGGFKDFAKKKGIYVLRQGAVGNESRFAFNYQEFIKGKSTKQNIMLEPRDTIVVP